MQLLDLKMDGEYNTPVKRIPQGRKRRVVKRLAKKSVRSLKAHEPRIKCIHLENKDRQRKKCFAKQLAQDDITKFAHHLKSQNTKKEEDIFLLKYMNVRYPKRKRNCLHKKPRMTSIYYYMRNYTTNKKVPVCAEFFKNITGAKTNRLALIGRYHLHCAEAPTERRGGDRSTNADKFITEAILKHISSFKCRESHYSRAKIQRSYLPAELNLNKMFEMFIKEQTTKGDGLCSLSKYKNKFYSEFNLGFGNPHSDTCSTCKFYDTKIKADSTTSEKLQELRTKKRLHLLRAKKFHSIMNKPMANTIDIVFDLQQNQPLPKLSIGEVFYSRQVWLYNLGIVVHGKKQEKKDVTFYTWLETEAGRGSNEITSALIHFLKNIEERFKINANDPTTKIRLFSDSCVAQNKNTILMTALVHFLENSEIFSEIKHYFPIKGHSYMPPDRVFGRIEKLYRKKEEILAPQEYYDLLEQHGTAKRLYYDWTIFDYKEASKRLLKAKLPFKISASRVICYSKRDASIFICVSNTYAGDPIEVSPFKSSVQSVSNSINEFQVIPRRNMVSTQKRDDVKKLMQFFTVPESAKGFYFQILEGNGGEISESIAKVYDEVEDTL